MPGHFVNELRSTFAERRAHAALVAHANVYSYDDLAARAERAAGWLQSIGLARGGRVALCTPSKLPFLAAHLGTLWAGGVALPVNPKMTADELRYVLADSEAAIALVGSEQLPTIQSLRPELPRLRAIVLDEDAWDPPQAPYHEPAPAHDDPCLMLYSSGTTGRPKGVVHTNANLAASLRALQRCWRFTGDDVLVNALPLFHIHGLSFATQLSLLSGGTMRIEEAFHPRRTLEAIGQGTVFMAIPTFYYAFLERPEFRAAANGWKNVRLFTCGSAPIRPEVLPELESILERPVINRYGMTEGHVIASLPLDGPWPTGSVGLPLEGIELRLCGEEGAPASAGTVGSVQLRGPNLFREYWGKPEATREAFASGWFDTGDLGTLDAAGFLTLVGRKNDLIITSGFNVYPQVVERVLNECPGVRESAVLGVPDNLRGERVAAFVVRGEDALDERALRAFCAERLVDYQRPTHYSFVDALPRNAMGKILRRELRDQIAPSASAPREGRDAQ